MRRFVHRENIKRLQDVLERTTNEVERRTVEQLLSDEEAKLQEVEQAVSKNAFSDPSALQVRCAPCKRPMSLWRFHEMEIRGRGRLLAAMFLCDKCNTTQLVLGDKPIAVNEAAE